MKDSIDVVFSFDTTGSMYPCLTQVRKKVQSTVKRLFKEIPNIRIGIIAHGDYCDADNPYVTKIFDLSSKQKSICNFIQKVEPTFGGDAPECYELVLHEARSLNWEAGRSRVLVVIGDDVPHGPSYKQNKKNLDWRNELALLLESNVNVYGVQALNRSHATKFYKEIAKKTGGFHLTLDQFAYVTDLVMAICYKQAGNEQLQYFEQEIIREKRMNRNMDLAINTLLGRKPKKARYKKSALAVVAPGRFQVLEVEKDCSIRQFVEENGLTFKTGRGFYEFTKTVTVQAYKEVILMEDNTGDFFAGDKAREILELPIGEQVRAKPPETGKYIGFVQSTSYNRKLLAGTRFLYEVDDWDRAAA